MRKVTSGQPIADLVYTPPVTGTPSPATDTIKVYVFDKDGFLIDTTAAGSGGVTGNGSSNRRLCDEDAENASVTGYYYAR